jgi:hypothetical protein
MLDRVGARGRGRRITAQDDRLEEVRARVESAAATRCDCSRAREDDDARDAHQEHGRHAGDDPADRRHVARASHGSVGSGATKPIRCVGVHDLLGDDPAVAVVDAEARIALDHQHAPPERRREIGHERATTPMCARARRRRRAPRSPAAADPGSGSVWNAQTRQDSQFPGFGGSCAPASLHQPATALAHQYEPSGEPKRWLTRSTYALRFVPLPSGPMFSPSPMSSCARSTIRIWSSGVGGRAPGAAAPRGHRRRARRGSPRARRGAPPRAPSTAARAPRRIRR